MLQREETVGGGCGDRVIVRDRVQREGSDGDGSYVCCENGRDKEVIL